MTHEKRPLRHVIIEIEDGRKIYIERAVRRSPGLTIGIGGEDSADDEIANLPDADDGKEN